MRHALLVAFALLSLSACFPHVVISDTERDRVFRELSGDQRYLRVAVQAAPLWGETSKLLLSDMPLHELDLVQTGGGTSIAPPRSERVIAPGTPVRIREVEFPTGWIISKRVVMSPRYHPWVLLDVPGESRPGVIVLSQVVVTFEDVRGELDRVLSKDDPSPFFAALPKEQRDAVLEKRLVEGMSTRAAEMAWGLPERKRIDRPQGTEEWTWPEAKRKAFFQDERLVRWVK